MFTINPSKSEISINLEDNLDTIITKYTEKSIIIKKNKKKMKLKIIEIIISLLTIACFMTASYSVIKNILQYFTYETFNTVQFIDEHKAIFPAISICNSDKTNSWRTYYPKILKCSFDMNNECSNQWDHYFETYNDTYYGVCYRFNSGKNINSDRIDILNSRQSGELNGFKLEIFVQSSIDYSRLKVYIHNQTLKPSSIYGKGHYISSGSFNYFSINRIFEQQLPTPYGVCLKDVGSFLLNKTIIDFIANNNQTYEFEECIRLCENLHFKESSKCACNLTSLDDLLYYKCPFDSIDQDESLTKCILNFKAKFQANESTCFNYCPKECDTIKYKISHYSETLPLSGKIINNPQFSEFDNYDDMRRSYFEISVFYEDHRHLFIREEPKRNIFDLIPSLGMIFCFILALSFLISIKINNLTLFSFV